MMLLLKRVEEFVSQDMSRNDGSHDMKHVERVRRLALKIAQGEGITKDMDEWLVIECAALLHDVKDHKYANGDGLAGQHAVKDFLEKLFHEESVELPPTFGLSKEEFIDRVVFVVANVSYSKQVARSEPIEMTRELAITQDADRLDAIGAIGVARCFTFGGTKCRPLYEYSDKDNEVVGREADKFSCIGHFYDKLFKLKDLLNTETGKREGERRHKFLETFVEELIHEVEA